MQGFDSCSDDQVCSPLAVGTKEVSNWGAQSEIQDLGYCCVD